MLLPALNKAKETAKRISCVNNLSSIGKAVAMYIDDNKGYISAYYNNGKGMGNGGSYSSGAGKQFFGVEPDYGLTDYLNEKTTVGYIGGIRRGNDGTLNFSKFCCPSEDSIPQTNGTVYPTLGHNLFITTWSSLKADSFVRPSDLMIVADKNALEPTTNLRPHPSIPYISWRHSLGMNGVFLGGNVDSMKYGDSRILKEDVNWKGCLNAPTWHAGSRKNCGEPNCQTLP
jgi:hypothetical protein